ncbi:MAG TPA: hypothetical protein VG028_13685 [Terriglobia bacterium]|nr:hypothetical protein [Terriglobia bacterium]
MDAKTQPFRQGGDGGSDRRIAVDLMDRPEKTHMLPVWFFIGAILLIYGVLIVSQGILEYSDPPVANYHAPVWWGVVMVIVGGIFFQRFYPRKK